MLTAVGVKDVPREGGSGQRAWSQVISVSFEEGPVGSPPVSLLLGSRRTLLALVFPLKEVFE